MKLVDILARELKVWPYSDDASASQDDDKYIAFFESGDQSLTDDHQSWSGNSYVNGSLTTLKELASDWKTAKVTRAEWQAAVDALNVPKAVEWDGAGLPPVGLDVEIKRGNCTWIDGDEWQIGKTATVMASFLNSRDIEMASVQFPGGHCECILARCLSPVRTAEQMAAEERKKAIQSMRDEIGYLRPQLGPCPVEKLYDANYRKQVTK